MRYISMLVVLGACHAAVGQEWVELNSWRLDGVSQPQSVIGTLSNGDLITQMDDTLWIYNDRGALISSVPFPVSGGLIDIDVDASDVLYGLGNNNKVYIFDSSGAAVGVGIFGATGSGDGQFINPSGISVAPNGDIWVADEGNLRVQHFDANGSFLGKFRTVNVSIIEIGDDGNIYAADSCCTAVLKISPTGTLMKNWDTGLGGPVKSIRQASNGMLFVAADQFNIFSLNGDELGRFGIFGVSNRVATNAAGQIYGVSHNSTRVLFVQFILTAVTGCPKGDMDGDCDVDLDDFKLWSNTYTGAQVATVFVRATEIADANATAGSYLSGGQDLSGFTWQASGAPGQLDAFWTIESQPTGSGTVTIFDPMMLASQFVIAAPAMAGDYVFRLTVTNMTTGAVGFEEVIQTLQ